MEITEQAKYIDTFLKTLYESFFPISFARAIEKSESPSKENKEIFKTLEYLVEELDLVQLIRGRDNSTKGGQCEYLISYKGREMVESNISSLQIIFERNISKIINNNLMLNKELSDQYFDERINKRVNEADFYLTIVVSEKLLNIDKPTIEKHFKEWYKENKEFDLQVKDGDFIIEDGDIQDIPKFNESDISEFVKWFKLKKGNFLNYLKQQGVEVETELKGQTIIGNVYNINGTVGAVGPNSSAYGNQFQQNNYALPIETDYKMLENELISFKKLLLSKTTSPDHYSAISEVAKAEEAAKNRDGAKVVKALLSAGKWALDASKEITTNVLSEIIKKQIG